MRLLYLIYSLFRRPAVPSRVRSVQDVFNVVIRSGFYAKQRGGYTLMCSALSMARFTDVITREEYKRAISEIVGYLDGAVTLKEVLKNNSLPHQYKDRLKIYKNWAYRPDLIP